MSDVSAEKLAQRAFQLNLFDGRELEIVRSELGSDSSPEAFRSVALRKELLTNYQYEKLIKGETSGYFYGDYRVLYLTGTGTFARVYRCSQNETGKIFAVKVLRKRFRDKPFELASFLREGELGVQLRHPNIVPIYEVSNNRSEPFLVMDFIEGQNLRDFVKVRKKLDPTTSLRLMTEIASALAYAAAKGIYHRDLKLSNSLVSSRGNAKLVDFGLYGVDAGGDGGDALNPRTVDYVALEKFTGVKRDDTRSDIFFAGCMFYHMLTGTPPLLETRDKQVRSSEQRFRDIKPLGVVDNSLPRCVATVVQKAMEMNADKRYQTQNEFLFDLQIAAKRLAAGETTPLSAFQNAGAAPRAVGGVIPADQEGISRTILIVESKIDMQNMLRERLKKYGYRVLIISDPSRAMGRFDETQQGADCVVFSTMELGDSALAAFNQFGIQDTTKQVPAILFLDEHQSDLAARAMLAPHRALLKMPVTVRDLREKLRLLLADKPLASD